MSTTPTPDIRTAAQAVVDRWDTPFWKDVPATAEYIGRLRAALAAGQAVALPDAHAAWSAFERLASNQGSGVDDVDKAGMAAIRDYLMRAARVGCYRATRGQAQAAPPAVAGPSWEALHHAWMKIGADVAGLDWGAFTNAVHYAPTTQPAPQREPVVHPRHPVVVKWRNSGIEACAGIADAYGCKNAAMDMRAMLTREGAAPQPSPAAQGDA